MVGKGRKKGTVRFSLTPPDGFKKVSVAGSFDDGTPHAMRKGTGGVWSVTLAVGPGTYEYKFIADGQWMPDSDCDRTVSNRFGATNSVLQVEG